MGTVEELQDPDLEEKMTKAILKSKGPEEEKLKVLLDLYHTATEKKTKIPNSASRLLYSIAMAMSNQYPDFVIIQASMMHIRCQKMLEPRKAPRVVLETAKSVLKRYEQYGERSFNPIPTLIGIFNECSTNGPDMSNTKDRSGISMFKKVVELNNDALLDAAVIPMVEYFFGIKAYGQFFEILFEAECEGEYADHNLRDYIKIRLRDMTPNRKIIREKIEYDLSREEPDILNDVEFLCILASNDFDQENCPKSLKTSFGDQEIRRVSGKLLKSLISRGNETVIERIFYIMENKREISRDVGFINPRRISCEISEAMIERRNRIKAKT